MLILGGKRNQNKGKKGGEKAYISRHQKSYKNFGTN